MSESSHPVPPVDPATLSRLAGGLAHELKNPLSTVGLHLSLLREEWQKQEGVQAQRSLKTIDVLEREVRRLDEILEDFLRFARTDSMETHPADLNDLVSDVLQFVGPEAHREGIRLEAFLDYDLPRFPLDLGRAKQALLNLIINARQALSGGGNITVITRKEEDEAVLEVVDDGPGMSPELQEKCMEVYFSTKSKGSGLGLPLIRRVVEAHGGHLTLESSEGHGTRFTLRFPMGG
ncbi:MAG: ATP-binding protein [Planctomycetota bacterium]|nr:ATP-binding protein [Planctomycetota bacterium]